jgi:hypothetical protein
MSPKRGDDVPPPPIDKEWRLRFATNEAAKGWSGLCTEAPVACAPQLGLCGETS